MIMNVKNLVVITIIALLFGCSTEKYTEVEKYIIQRLKDKMHDPESLEIVSITSVDFYADEIFEKMPFELKLTIAKLQFEAKNLDNPKVYTINYRGKNAFGALRLNSIMAVASETKVKGVFFCLFFSEDDLKGI